MGAELLRKAAEILRERANVATPGPWEEDGCGEISQHWSRPEPWAVVASNEIACMSYCYGGSARGIENRADAVYIATMHPGVGLALADLLDHLADEWPAPCDAPGPPCNNCRELQWSLVSSLALARLIVGEPS